MSLDAILNTDLPLPAYKRGKVRDIYDLGEKLLIVSTDRISAFDVVLPTGIPSKGEALTRLSVYWFDKLKDVVPNHLLEVVDPRTVLAKKTEPIRIEFVVRGYLYGSAWEKYEQGNSICGACLPEGLRKAEKLDKPVLTPTTKAEMGHDVEMTGRDVVEAIGEEMAARIGEICLRIYEKSSREAEAKGIIVADTKMEFGVRNGQLLLIDEVLTPDSSRFWAGEEYEVGKSQPSFDKQHVRDYLTSIRWNKKPPAPKLPDRIVHETSKKYVEAYERLTSRSF